MSDYLQCPQHGLYPANLVVCPYCGAGGLGLPPAPTPLSDEETSPKGVPATMRIEGEAYSDDDETIMPGQQVRKSAIDEETQLPVQRGGGSLDYEDKTELPRRRKRILDEDEEVDETVIDREDTTLMGWLFVKKSPILRRGHFVKIRKGLILGRNPSKADFLIDDEKVSGMHARIQIKEQSFVLIDLGSSNGTWLNGEEVIAATQIKQDDEIRIGDTFFVLKTL